MKKYVVSAMLLLFVIPALVFSSSAYVKLSHTMNTELVYHPYEGFSYVTRTHMRNAASVWNAAMGNVFISISSSTQPNRSGYPKNDGNNYIYAEDVGQGYAAQNHYWWSSSNKVTQSDININMYYSWADSAVEGAYDVYSVFLHELGHTVGLGDVKEASYKDKAVMYHAAIKNAERRKLLSDDISGVQALYGS